MKIIIDQMIRSKRRTVSLQITPQGELMVRAPLRASLHLIEKFVEEKQDWILKNQEKIRQRTHRTVKKEFVEGEKFYFLGHEYQMKLADIKPSSVFFTGNEFLLSRIRGPHETTLFKNWYKKAARQTITERVNIYSQYFQPKHKNIKITSAEKRWGSCSAKNTLNFSWRLVMAPLKVVDYVVIHELTHMEHKNHSRNFWQKVESVMPDYKEQNIWLRKNGHELII